MYLSDRDIRWAIDKGLLIIDPKPDPDPTSIDLHLDHVSQAKIWNVEKFRERDAARGQDEPEVRLGSFNYTALADEYLCPPPTHHTGEDNLVSLRGEEVIVKPRGFLLWQTKETVGTPPDNPRYICFVDGKSTRARTGIVVHLTAPTIHAGWQGHIVLEIANLGPLTFVLKEDDVIAQLTVAMISSVPEKGHVEAGSSTIGQIDVGGRRSPESSACP
jgi:dCTP deaminase